MEEKVEFYKETDFKDTEIGRIPKEWGTTTLGKISSKITDGTHITPKFVSKGVPFITTKNIVPFKSGFDFQGYEKYISEEEHARLINRCKPEKGDLLVSKCGTIGRTKLIDVDYEFSIFVGLALIKLKNKEMGPFLEQLLNYKPYVKRMELASPGATRKTLTIGALEDLIIPIPPLPEQQKISEILSNIDETIQKTDDIIAKTEALKKGLMQELFTKGIGHKEFKDTEIGKTPKEWEVVELGKISNILMGQSPPGKTYNNDGKGIPFLQGKAEFGPFYPRHIKFTTYPLKIAESGSILISVRAPVGDVNIANINYCIGRGLASISVRKGSNIFLFYLLKYFKQNIEKEGTGSTFKAINKNKLENVKIPWPSLEEQQKIAEILLILDKKLEVLKQEKVKLEKIKQWFMDELLTGKIRVRVS